MTTFEVFFLISVVLGMFYVGWTINVDSGWRRFSKNYVTPKRKRGLIYRPIQLWVINQGKKHVIGFVDVASDSDGIFVFQHWSSLGMFKSVFIPWNQISSYELRRNFIGKKLLIETAICPNFKIFLPAILMKKLGEETRSQDTVTSKD